MKISFLGDISLNNQYVEFYKQGINPFVDVEPILSQCDFVVGNLECMAKGDFGENLLKQPRLTTTVETLNYLKNLNLSVACLAQNHIYDHLEDGFNKTTDFLKENNIKHLGAGYSIEQAKEPLILSKDRISIGILNYVTEDTNPNLPLDAKIFLNMFKIESCIKDIQALKGKVNHIVLSLHWGGRVEGGLYPDWDQPKIARKLIDAGADLIIGHHSHTLQPYEVYKGKYIFYSLGNFCFADVNVNGKIIPLNYKRSNPSIILDVVFEREKYLVKFKNIRNIEDIIIIDKTNNKRLKQFSESTLINNYYPIWKTYFFYEKKIYPIMAYFFANGRNPIHQFSNLKWNSFLKHSLKLIKFNKI